MFFVFLFFRLNVLTWLRKLQVRELTFTFEINQSQVKRYMDILKETQSQDMTKSWLLHFLDAL